jgi:TPP-dependent trihydroxycyclohexane-1,2-dione (THcHDO) dehydratase
MGGTCNTGPEENYSEYHTENQQGMIKLNITWDKEHLSRRILLKCL